MIRMNIVIRTLILSDQNIEIIAPEHFISLFIEIIWSEQTKYQSGRETCHIPGARDQSETRDQHILMTSLTQRRLSFAL